VTRIKLASFSKEDLQKIISESFDKTEVAVKLGYKLSSVNGQTLKKVQALIESYDISIVHFDASKKNRARRKYPVIKKNCPICGKEFETQQGHPKETTTCSWSCSNVLFYDARHTPSSNIKRSNSLNAFHELNGTKREKLHKNCLWCQTSFVTLKKNKRFCSQRCATKYNWQDENYRNNLTVQLQQRIASGNHKGWSARSKLEPSFPEKVVIDILEELNIKLERELKISKWFIDFADTERKIAIEIDGKQHNLPERKSSDELKDAYLFSQGWQVYRIKWKKLTKEIRQELKDTIERILYQGGV
jgi:very-short-patch-repair endonuclease/predicted nucleic acid-binding Zn ribbon protein